MADMTLQMILKLKDEATASLDKAKEATKGLNLGAVALGGAAVAGVTAVAGALWSAAQAAGEEELGVARLGAAVTATGADWSTAQTAIEAYLAAETSRVALDDGEGRASISRLTTATGDYQTALTLMPGVMDLAKGAGISLEAATNLVTKAVDGSTAGLGKYGIEVEKGASATEILGAIQATMGGQAEAYGNTFVGSQEKMDIALGNIKETIGAAVLPALTDLITKFSEIATQALPYVEEAFGVLSNAIGAVMPTITSVINTALGIIIPALEWFFAFLQDPGAVMFETLQTTVETVMPIIQNVITTVLGALSTFWTEHGTQVMSIVTTAFNNVRTTIETIMGVVQGVIATVMALIHGDWSGAWEAIKGVLQTAWNGITTVVTNTLDAIKPLIAGAWDAVKATATAKWEEVKVSIKGKWDDIYTAINTALSNVGNRISAVWTDIKARAIGAWDDLVAALRGINNNIWEKVFKDPWTRVQTFFTGIYNNLRDWIGNLWEGVRIKTPHFSISWEDIIVLGLRVGAKPNISVDWYGKGGSFLATEPTLIGVGERGAEYVNITPQGQAGGGGTGTSFISGALYDKASQIVVEAIKVMAEQICDSAEINKDWMVYTFKTALSKGIDMTMTALKPMRAAIVAVSDQMQIDLQPLVKSMEVDLGVTSGILSDLKPAVGSMEKSLGTTTGTLLDLRPAVGGMETALNVIEGSSVGTQAQISDLVPKIGGMEIALAAIDSSSMGIQSQITDLRPMVGNMEVALNGIDGNSVGIPAQISDLRGVMGTMEMSLMNMESRGTAAPVIEFHYSPVLSLATQDEAYDVIAPMLREVMAREARR